MGDSMLNFTELLRRIGVKNRTGVDLSETVRMQIAAGDLSHLVPPIAVPVAGASALVAPGGAGTFAQFSLQCLAAGGLFPLTGVVDQADLWRLWKTAANPFGALAPVVATNLAFGEVAQSVYAGVAVAGATAAPADAPEMRGAILSELSAVPIFVGPGEFLNFEVDLANIQRRLTIYWQEIPAAQRLP